MDTRCGDPCAILTNGSGLELLCRAGRGHFVRALLLAALTRILLTGGLRGVLLVRARNHAGEQREAEHEAHNLLHLVVLLGEFLVEIEINYGPSLQRHMKSALSDY